jgi:alpha-ribazole phosphatase
MKLWLLRHPKPDVPEGLCYGASDVPIVASHLESLLTHLPGRLPRDAALYSSPLSRCRQLAESLTEHGFGPLQTDDRLREMNFGHWEGRLWKELPRHEIDAWRADIAGHVPPGGEALSTVAARGLAFVSELPTARPAILVTHSGVMQALLRTLRGLPLAGAGGHKIDYGQVVVLERERSGERWEITNEIGAG